MRRRWKGFAPAAASLLPDWNQGIGYAISVMRFEDHGSDVAFAISAANQGGGDMTKQQANRIVRTAFNSLPNGPRPIGKAIINAADLEDCTLSDGDLGHLLASIVGDDPNAEPRLKFERALHEWDYVENGDWTEGTGRNTIERRRVIYRKLRIDNDLSVRADDLIPVFILDSSRP